MSSDQQPSSDDISEVADSLVAAATTIAQVAEELAKGFVSEQAFAKHELEQLVAHKCVAWVASPRTGIEYAIRLDARSITETSARGHVTGTAEHDLSEVYRQRVSLTNKGGYIHLKLTF